MQTRMIRRNRGPLRPGDIDYLQQRLDRLADAVRWARQTDEHVAPWRR